MNGIIQKLAEQADISINVEDMICATVTSGTNAISCPDWYTKVSAKGIMIGADTAQAYISPCITIAKFNCTVTGTYFRNYTIKETQTFATQSAEAGQDDFEIKFITTNTAASCYLYTNGSRDSSRDYIVFFLKS